MMIRVRNVLENTMNRQSRLMITPCFFDGEVDMLVYSIWLKEDYKGWARGLRRAGYATDPNTQTN
jgi:flagellum-specific peptidoglycan hydrolase FlgJ